MTSILYWNIENFGVNKVQDPNQIQASADRFQYIMRHIADTDPDIFVIIEVETPYNDDRGTLCTGAGENGLAVIYNLLIAANAYWSLVPALKTGVKESVGVFYRSDRVQFTGPKLWAGGNGPTNDAVTALTASDYVAAGWPTLPVVAVAGGAGVNAGVHQNRCAAAVEFRQAPPPLGGLGPYFDWGDTRSPYQTTFWDGARDINIITVHAPANFVAATQFLADMATLPEINGALGANEVRLVLGDFNLNALSGANTYSNCYQPLTHLGYTVGLRPGAVAGAPVPAYRGYFCTHIAARGKAKAWSTNTRTTYYPAYAYNSNAWASIDNVLWASLLPMAPNLTVINGLVGSPYRAANGVTGAPNLGNQIFDTDIDWNCANENPQWPPNAPDVGVLHRDWTGINSWFRGWGVYGRTRSTSDHLPLYFAF